MNKLNTQWFCLMLEEGEDILETYLQLHNIFNNKVLVDSDIKNNENH
ncbi:hypothetical protein ACQKFK_32490 [Bacillus mycoides]